MKPVPNTQPHVIASYCESVDGARSGALGVPDIEGVTLVLLVAVAAVVELAFLTVSYRVHGWAVEFYA